MNEPIKVLDKGYILLKDTMGDDLRVVNAAKASFAKESEEFGHNEDKLLRFLIREGHWSPFRHAFVTLEVKAPLFIARQWWKYCFSEDTEVLTSDGWKFWPEVSKLDKLAAVTESGKFDFETPSDLIAYHYSGNMVHLDGRATDLLMTPNHRMFVSKRDRKFNSTNFTFYRADDLLKGEYKLPLLPIRDLEEGSTRDYMLGYHYGFSLAEGNFTATKNRVYFIVKKDRERQAISFLRESLPDLDWKDHVAEDGFIKVSSLKPDLDAYSGSLLDKSLKLDSLPKTLSAYRGVLDGYFDGDGSENQTGTRQICSISEDLINDFQMIATYLGIPTSRFTLDSDRLMYGNRPVHYLTLSKNKYRHTSRMKRSLVPYDNMVYCATVSTGLLLVRRNGKVSVSGNCVGSDHTMDAWNEASRRYITMDTEFHLPEAWEWRSVPDNRKQGSGPNLDPFVGDDLTHVLRAHQAEGERLYEWAIEEMNVAPEQARLFLPAYGLYTNWWWSCSLQSLCHFLYQRLADDAQYELQLYARAVCDELRPHFPVVFDALVGAVKDD